MPRPRLLLTNVLLSILVSLPAWSAEGASPLEALVARSQALEKRQDQREEIAEAEIRDLESGFISLLRQDPGNRAVLAQAASFYARWSWPLKTPAAALLDLVQASPDLAVAFAEPVGEGEYPLQAQIVLAALSSRQQDSELWETAAKLAPGAASKIAFQEEAFRVRLTGAASPAESPTAAALAERWLGRLLKAGLTRRALAAYRELPPEVRARIDGDSAAPHFDPEVNEHRDLRLELAASAFLEGDRETASRLLRTAVETPSVRRPLETGAHERDAILLLQRLMERALTPTAEDGFPLLTQADSGMEFEWVPVMSLLVARLAEREAYPALAAFELHTVTRGFQREEDGPVPLDLNLPARLQKAQEGLEAERVALVQSLEDEARGAEAAARTALGPDPAAPVIARLLTTPAAIKFSEHPLPEGIKPIQLTDDQIEARLKAAAQGLHLPSALHAVRIEKKGRKVTAIVTSQSLDPEGEVSAGAYWVLLSDDGGATWKAPLYTGLRIHQSYVVRPVSALPLFQGDHLSVEVENRELDPSTITFPPIALAPKRTAQGLFLDLPLANLTPDSDGDGWTDLAEARLLTDPRAADTDGDGLADGRDPMPGVSRSADSSPATLALATVVEAISGVGGRALIGGVDGSPSGVICCGPRKGPPAIEPTVFFVAERPLFAGLSPDRRVIVLTRDEADAVAKTLGPFYPLEISLFLLDHTGRHGFVIWSATWQGGALKLEEKDGRWTAEEVGGWIT
jgi:hypothetical protein